MCLLDPSNLGHIGHMRDESNNITSKGHLIKFVSF